MADGADASATESDGELVTSNSAVKRAARSYGRQHGVGYRAALRIIGRRGDDRFEPVATRILIEAIEGCGIRHWARIDAWDGRSEAVITDLGGEVFDLSIATMTPAVVDLLERDPECDVVDIDSYLADEIVQQCLFGLVLYRSEVRRRPTTG